MQMLGGPRHDAIQWANAVEQVTGMNTDIRFNLDDPIDRLGVTA